MTVVKAVVERLNNSGSPIQRRDETVISAEISRNGSRTINEGIIEFSVRTAIRQNDRLKYIQDAVDTTYLSGIWNFQGSGKDESGYDLHAEDSSGDPPISRFMRPNGLGNTDRFRGQYGITFDGNGQELEVPNTRQYYGRLDFSRQFDVYVWCQYNTSDDFRNLQPGDVGIIFSNADPGTAGFDIGFKIDPTGVPVTFARFFYTTGLPVELTGTRLFFNRRPTLIRITRDENDRCTVYNNGAAEFSFVRSDDMDSKVGITFGDRQHPSSSEPWTGELFQVRAYSGSYLSDDDAEAVRLAYPQPLTMKLDGRVWKVNDDTQPVVVHVKDNNGILINADMTPSVLQEDVSGLRRENVYDAGVLHSRIIESMITAVDPGFAVKQVSSRNTMFDGKFVATQSLIQCMDLILLRANMYANMLTNRIILMENVDGNGITTPYVFQEGVENQRGVIITNSGRDDVRKTNDVELIGRVRFKRTISMANISSSNLTVTLARFPLDLRIYNDDRVMIEDTDYGVDYETRTVTFDEAVGPVSIETVYEDLETDSNTRLYCRYEDDADINASGRYSRRLFVPQFTEREDIDQMAQDFVRTNMAVNDRYEIMVPWHANHIIENRIIGIRNTFKGIDTTAPVRSVRWKYPQMTTVIEAGEYKFDQFDVEQASNGLITSAIASTIKTHNSDQS